MTFVFLITTNLFFLASMVVFNINPLYTWPIYALFLLIDGAYLSANLFKFLTGESGFHSNVLHAFHNVEGEIWPCRIHAGMPDLIIQLKLCWNARCIQRSSDCRGTPASSMPCISSAAAVQQGAC